MKRFILCGALVAGLWTSGVSAASETDACTLALAPSQVICSLGDRDPVAFGSANQRAELATGEIYQLTGRVRSLGGRKALEIDFCSHPWLASKMRRSFPFYFLQSVPGLNWGSYLGQKVTVLFRAKGRIALHEVKSEIYTLTLQAVSPPEQVKGL